MGAGSVRVPRSLGGGLATQNEFGSCNALKDCIERAEFGRGRMLRSRRSGDARAAQAEPPIMVKEKKGLPDGYMEEMQEFLKKDLVHLFDEQGIDKTMYDQKVEFRDPITNYDTLDGYLFNISMLRELFHPIFELHSVKQVY